MSITSYDANGNFEAGSYMDGMWSGPPGTDPRLKGTDGLGVAKVPSSYPLDPNLTNPVRPGMPEQPLDGLRQFLPGEYQPSPPPTSQRLSLMDMDRPPVTDPLPMMNKAFNQQQPPTLPPQIGQQKFGDSGIGSLGGGGKTNVSLNLQGSATMNPQGTSQNRGYTGFDFNPAFGSAQSSGGMMQFAKGGSIPQGIASLGRGQDSMLVHMTPGEVQGLQRLAMAHGGSLTINPQTGLPEAGFLSAMLPMLASAAAIALAPATMGASTVALLGAGAGALTGALTNKQSPLMGAVMGGISGYGMGSIGEGLSAAGTASELNTAAEIGRVSSPYVNEFAPPVMSTALTPADLTAFKATQMGKDILAKNNIGAGLQGLMPGADNVGQNYSNFIGQTAKDSATKQATGLGGGLAATMKGAGLVAPLVSSALTPNKFVPPPVKPPTFYNTSYQPPKYNPATGMYDPASYGPGSNSTVYGAEGGAVGYKQGDLVAEAYYGEGVTTGGPGNPGKEPERSRNIYGDEDVRVSQEMPYSDAGGIHSNIKPNKNTPAKQVLAAYKAAKKAKGLRALLKEEDDDIEYAAEGGLMGVNTYAAGGKLLRGPGDGMSDSIPAVIQGAKPQRAALADGEFVVPADVVSHLGNGSTEAGSRQLYAMMNKIRKARTGNPKQGKQINPARFMPA